MRNIVIIGDSGHSKVIADIVNSLEEFKVFAKLDDKHNECFVENGIIKGPINYIHNLLKAHSGLGVIVGIGTNIIRKEIISKLGLSDEMYINAIHKSSIISPSVKIGIGTVVMPGAIINADAMIGRHVIVNSGSVVEHDCVVGDFAHISPRAVLTGGVSICEGVHIGAGASVIPQKSVGTWATVGAGAVVVSDIEDKTTVVGVPARVVKREGLLMTNRILLSPPHMSGNEQKYINEAFETNWIAPLGPNVDAFENEMAEYVDSKGAAALSSGTAAIHLALELLGVGKGDRVFCASLTFVASANPILYVGAEPVFIDSEEETWNMSPVALARAFEDAQEKRQLPKAVIVVNLYGQSAKMDELSAICDRYDVPLIEDAAESLGSLYKGKKSGTFGKFGIFSFNGNKIITTSGGGMLVSNDVEELTHARFLATQARDVAKHYQHSVVGYNYRLSNILAGVGRAQLEVLDERVFSRRAVFVQYEEALGGIEGVSFMPELEGTYSNRWLTAMLLDPEKVQVTPSELIDALEEQNIEARPVWKPLHLQPLFEDCSFYPHAKGNIVSERLFERGVCLPSGSSMTGEEQERVIRGIREKLGVGVESASGVSVK